MDDSAASQFSQTQKCDESPAFLIFYPVPISLVYIRGEESASVAEEADLSVMIKMMLVERLYDDLVAKFANKFLNFAIRVFDFEKGISAVPLEIVGR